MNAQSPIVFIQLLGRDLPFNDTAEDALGLGTWASGHADDAPGLADAVQEAPDGLAGLVGGAQHGRARSGVGRHGFKGGLLCEECQTSASLCTSKKRRASGWVMP